MRRNKTYNGLGGFSSHASAMISSIKNNTRKRVSTFQKLKNYKKINKESFKNKNVISKEDLAILRKKIQEENNSKKIRFIIVFLLFLLILVYVIGFVKL